MHLAQIRDQGYAIDDREHRPHRRAAAAPIFATGAAVASLVASMSADQQQPPHLRVLVDDITDAAATLTQALNAIGDDGSTHPAATA
jgi:DNA-binding IclR family transcriptional regulator